MTTHISAQELFTGSHWISEAVIEIKNGEIIAIKKEGYDHLHSVALVVPALIDLQIYGAENKLLSAFADASTIEKIYSACLKGGTAFFQPTVATESTEIIYRCIDAVKSYKTNGGKGCIGLHIEGPWINASKKGAHSLALVHPPTLSEVRKLLDYGKEFISMITLAPEICDQEIIDVIQESGIVVSAGHTSASYEIATAFFNNKITVATHLYNAMSGLQHRAPGVVGALFNHRKAMCSIIADGHHVDFAAIKIAKKIMGDRLFCITDAVTATSTGLYQHELVGDKYESGGILSGSALTQIKTINNLVTEVGIDLGEAIRMCSVYPSQVMQIPEMTGKIIVNSPANLLLMNSDRRLLKMIVA